MNYPEVVDYAPLHINAQALRKAIEKYDDPKMETVAFAIASYADPRGVAFPGIDLLARITGYTVQEVSRYAHWLQAAGVFVIRKMKAEGAPHAHNVYRFAKSFIRRVADVTSAHFIANVKKWRAEGRDVAQALKKRARQSLDTLTAKAEKMAALFQARPELMDAPEQAAQIAGVAETPETVEIPAVSQPSEWESFEDSAPVAWEDGAQAGPTAVPTAPAVQVQAVPLQSQPPETVQTEPPRVYASWRDRVAAYRKETAAA